MGRELGFAASLNQDREGSKRRSETAARGF